MKLRNKKTGESIDGCFVVGEYDDGERFSVKDKPVFDSLAELNAEWEDYIPKEPLIKDDKIRKVVRAWAYINSVKTATYDEFHHDSGLNVFFFEDDEKENAVIQFYGWIPTLKEGEDYTITELCGEEE